MPKLKRFRSDVEDVIPMTWWPFTECGSTRNAKDELKTLFPAIEPFATPKPERGAAADRDAWEPLEVLHGSR